MTGWVSNGNCNLSTANNGYRIEAANPGTFNATTLALTTNRNISVTFANAGNCQGVALSLVPSTNGVTSTSTKDVRVTLQQIMGAVTTSAAADEVTFTSHGFSDGQEVEFSATGGGITVNVKYFARVTGSSVPANTFFLYDTLANSLAGGPTGLLNITASVTPTLYAIRANKQLTGDEICGGTTTDCRCASGYIRDFTFTTPYAVDTTAGKWRFNVIHAGSNTNNWALRTSDATNPFYITWCDNVISFTSGSDWIYCKDVVTMTASASVTGSGNLSTGESTLSICAIVGVGKSGITTSTVSNFLVPASTGTATLTINGGFIISGHGGVQIGSSASPYPAATPLTISIVAATSGTNTNTGFRDCSRTVGSEIGQKPSLIIYGEYPTVEDAILASDVSTGASSITTTTTTNWVNGDTIYIGGIDVAGVGTNVLEFTVSSSAGTTVNLTSSTATNTRKAQGRIVRSNGYGVIIEGPSTTVKAGLKITGASNLMMSGVKMKNIGINIAGGSDNYSYDNDTSTTVTMFEHCFFEATSATTRTVLGEFSTQPSDKGFVVDNVNSVKGPFIGVLANLADISGVSKTLLYTNNILLSSNFYSNATGFTTQHPNFTISGNVCENSGLGNITVSSANCVVSNNIFWRAQSTTGALNLNGAINLSGGGNIYNSSVLAIYLQNNVVNSILEDEIFGNIGANTTDVDMLSGSYLDIEIASPTGNVNVSTTNLALITAGSNVKISDNNDTFNDNKGFLPYGRFQTSGYNLSDTTARTSGSTFGAASSGNYAFRFQPTSSTNALSFSQKIPTGDIQGLTMTVAVWVKINSANYYAGTNQLPRLTVNYDNGTTAYAQAAQDASQGQLLFVSFTPTTTFGQITVTLSAATDASGSDAYIYWDDFSAQYPAGVTIDIGGMNIWANALPVTPMIATLSNLGQVWDELLASHTIPSTYGTRIKKLLETGQFIALK